MQKISVTDHNSVGMYFEINRAAESRQAEDDCLSKMLVGTELTVEGFPDLLVYYPDVSAGSTAILEEIESHLTQIRLNEERAIQCAYESLGFSEWERDEKRAFPQYARVSEARTRELASILYMKRTGNDSQSGYFEREDLVQARIARRSVGRDITLNCGDPYLICKKTGGDPVLAHPIRTAIKAARRNENYNYNTVIERLAELIDGFAQHGGNTIEWEYIEDEFASKAPRYPALQGHYSDVRQLQRSAIDKYNFHCVWGSDSHQSYPENYDAWASSLFLDFKDYLPAWISGHSAL
jgi:hypothetical protein